MEPHFAVSYSTLSQDALADFITATYNSGPFHVRLLVRGVSDTYLVQGEEMKYILRVYRAGHRDRGVIEQEVALLLALKDAAVSVSFPIPDNQGRIIQLFEAPEGTRYGVLFSFAHGNVVNALNVSQLQNLGREIARFHTISSATDPGSMLRVYDLSTTLFQPLEKTKDCFAYDPEGYQALVEGAEKVQIAFREMDTSSFSKGYCHFDLLPKNFYFDEDKVTFFDFDFLGYGWLVNDLMVYWQHLCLDIFFNRTTKEAAQESFRILTDAYREIRPLPDKELNAIPYCSLGFWLFYMQFHSTHDQFYPLIFEPSTLKMRTGLIRTLMDNNWYWTPR